MQLEAIREGILEEVTTKYDLTNIQEFFRQRGIVE